MPRRPQNPQDSEPEDSEPEEPRHYVPGVSEEVDEFARQKEELESRLVEMRERLRQREQEERERGAELAEHAAKLADAQAQATREQDELFADVRRILNLSAQGAQYLRIQKRYRETLAALGERLDDGFLHRHPVARMWPLFEMFCGPEE